MGLVARDVMERHVVNVSPDAPLASVQRLLFEEGIHGAPVVDDNGQLVGVVSSLDLLRAASEARDTPDADPRYLEELVEYAARAWTLSADEKALGEQTVSEVMSEEVVKVAAAASIAEVARTLRENRIHRVLVVEEGEICGIISSFDLLELLED